MPSADTIRAARIRHAGAVALDKGSEVTIAGQTYACTAVVGPLLRLPRRDGGGMIRVQNITLRILKSLLPVPPATKEPLTHDGVEFKTLHVGGQNATDVRWVIKAERFPQ